MQKDKKKRVSNPLDSLLGYFISIVISVVIVIYLGYHFMQGFGSEIVTEYATKITEYDAMEFDAYIFRNETVVYAETEGGVGYNYTDGTKVKYGAEIASIYAGNTQNHEAARSEIISIDKILQILRESNNIDGMASSDMTILDSKIHEYYKSIRSMSEQESYLNIPKKRDELLTLLNKRQLITGKIESFDPAIAELETEKENLTASLNAASETVVSPVTGYFYSSFDGYENIFSSDAVATLTVDEFMKKLSTEPETYSQSAVGKIATDFTWHIVIPTSRSELRYYNEGFNYMVQFPYNNDIQLKMNLSKVVSPDAGTDVLLVFSCREIPENFSFKRMQTVKVVRNEHTGYRVPISAVRQLDGKMGVYILSGSVVDFRYIDVLLECDGYYIVAERDMANDPEYYTKLGLYDLVITGGKDLYIGKMVS